MGNVTKDEALYQEMCRVVGKVVLEMRDLGQEPKHIVIAGVLRTALANQRVKRSELTTRRWKPWSKRWPVEAPAFRKLLKGAAEQVIDHTRKDKNGCRVNLHPVVHPPATVVSSGTFTINASDVSFSRLIKIPTSDGRILRSACGSSTRDSVCRVLKP